MTLKMGLVFPLLAGTVVLAEPADSVRVVKDVDYVAESDYAEGKDRLDLYLPETGKDFPVVVYFHGGGLRAGDRSGSVHVGEAFAGAGIGAAIVSYRLSPTVQHPEHAEDAARAIAWVRENIEAHGGDPEKIFLSGHSAGAYLVALLALDGRYLEAEGLSPKSLAGVMPVSGFFYVDLVAPHRPKDVWGEDVAVWKDASPSKYVNADAPPFLLLYADGDVAWRRQQNEDFAEALRSKGHGDVETVQIDDRDHQGIAAKIAEGDPAFETMRRFVAR